MVSGSHLDTQPSGGRFDGCYGVMAALEVARTLNDLGIATDAPFEVAMWTNEEGARFLPVMGASGAFAGVHTVEQILAARDLFNGRRDDARARADEAAAAQELERSEHPTLYLVGPSGHRGVGGV